MGKFAAVYDLPGGEQLLAVFCDQIMGRGPYIQLVTELDNRQVSVEIYLLEEDELSDPIKLMAARSTGKNSVLNLTEEEVKMFRRKIVSDAAIQPEDAVNSVSVN